MKKLSHEEIARNRLKTEDLPKASRAPITVLLDSVRSLYNVGSIFRTSDGAFIQQLILTGTTPRPPRKEIEKTALGSTTSVPWIYVPDPLEAIHDIHSRGDIVCCLEHTDQSTPANTLTPRDFPLCLVVGNEITGVSSSVLAQCDRAIEIPMYGMKHSLNVAVAYGIAVFELARICRGHSPH